MREVKEKSSLKARAVETLKSAPQAAREYANSTFGKWKGKCEI